MTTSATPRRQVRWVTISATLALMLGAAAVTGALGWWQWNRSHEQAITVLPEPTVPLADVLAPASSPGKAISRQVTVSGKWADADAAIVPGREVAGTPAEFLLRPLIVDAELTGTGEPATLAVVVGWRPEGDPVGPDAQSGTVSFDGFVRSAEQSMPGVSLPSTPVDGAIWNASMSVAELAQVWPGPLYSAVMVSYAGSPSWDPLPPLEPESSLNLRYLAYSLEWWIFGAFAVFIGTRWIRDNGFISTEDDAEPQGAAAQEKTAAVGMADIRKDQS